MRDYRKLAHARDGKKCVFCGSFRKINVHHLDKNRENNALNNLVTLCLKCHLKIHLKTPIYPHKRKIIKLRREGNSLGKIADILNLTKVGVAQLVAKENKNDPTIDEECYRKAFLRLNLVT